MLLFVYRGQEVLRNLGGPDQLLTAKLTSSYCRNVVIRQRVYHAPSGTCLSWLFLIICFSVRTPLLLVDFHRFLCQLTLSYFRRLYSPHCSARVFIPGLAFRLALLLLVLLMLHVFPNQARDGASGIGLAPVADTLGLRASVSRPNKVSKQRPGGPIASASVVEVSSCCCRSSSLPVSMSNPWTQGSKTRSCERSVTGER